MRVAAVVAVLSLCVCTVVEVWCVRANVWPDNIRNADDPGTSGTASGSAEEAGAVDAVVGLGSRPGIGSSGSKGKGVSFDLRGNTTSLIRS